MALLVRHLWKSCDSGICGSSIWGLGMWIPLAKWKSCLTYENSIWILVRLMGKCWHYPCTWDYLIFSFATLLHWEIFTAFHKFKVGQMCFFPVLNALMFFRKYTIPLPKTPKRRTRGNWFTNGWWCRLGGLLLLKMSKQFIPFLKKVRHSQNKLHGCKFAKKIRGLSLPSKAKFFTSHRHKS